MPEPVSTDLLLRQARKVRANKKLGQNFFVDADRLHMIVDALDLTENDLVIEIGPGLGFLTRLLSESGAKIKAIELDRNLVEKLTKQNLKNVEIIHGDFLDFDFSTLGDADTKLKFVGNIPYQITSPIISRIFGEIGSPRPWFNRIERVVITMQQEVADRLVASPGSKTYSQITLLKNYLFDAEILFTVPPECFYPVPDVNSATVLLEPLEEPPVNPKNLKLMRNLIKAGFKQRRKMLKNNLGFLKLDESEIRQLFKKTNINTHVRAEDLSLEKFAILSNNIEEMRPDNESESS